MSAATVEAPDRPEGAADDELSDEAREAIAKAEQESGETPDQDPMTSAYGPASQLTLLAGGEIPTESQFKLAGRSLELEGQFEKGESIVLRVGIKFGEVDFIDHEDAETGQVVKTIRRHKGKIVSYDVES
jgi:hypothetical protein